MSKPPPTIFPDLEAKLQKPSKQSAFEKQKAEAEAKRKREAAETAAAYEDFVKSFDGEDDKDTVAAGAHGGSGRRTFDRPPSGPAAFPVAGASSGTARRHFGPGLKSGPGSIGPPTAGYGRNRAFDGGYGQRDIGRKVDEGRGRLGFHVDERDGTKEKSYDASKGLSKAFETSDDEGDAVPADRAEERAVAKPTLRLANLPPRTSPAVIKALIPSNLAVENVKMMPPCSVGASDRKSTTAIVTLSKDTPATDMDAAVSSLQNRYLGCGFYLFLHRHLSSALISSTVATSSASSTTSQPFGAKPIAPHEPNPRHTHRQPHRGFAPPSSYAPPGPLSHNILHVPVQPPRDIKQLQLIHKVIESMLEHGPEFEALLMSRPQVQRDEKWAWLWDARSDGGVWYRWRLWEVITGSNGTGTKAKYLPLFEGSHAWKAPDKPLAYEYATTIDEFVSDPEYNSSDDEDFEDEANKHAEGGPGGDNDITYLNPLDKAKLAHLLARLPTTLGKTRKGDIARITTFATTHASRGADEIVDLIVTNIQKPLALTSANPEHKPHAAMTDVGEGKGDMDGEHKASLVGDTTYTSGASLVGLYVVSDILSSSATSGVRHGWRFRQLFETALREHKIFEFMGQTAERLKWGRMRAEKWKRSVGLVLSLWEGWCVFPTETHQSFVKSFESSPAIQKDEPMQTTNPEAEAEKKAGKWKTVEAAGPRGFRPIDATSDPVDVDMDDVDGAAMSEGDFGDEPMDDDIDGVPMDQGVIADPDGEPMDEGPPTLPSPADCSGTGDAAGDSSKTEPPERSGVAAPRKRLRAVDMFDDAGGDSS